jgi:ABC-type transport system substrate-binding protein
MSKPDQAFNRRIIYVLVGLLLISSIFIVIFFSPQPKNPGGLFSTTLRYYTKGTERVHYPDYALSIIQSIREVGIEVANYETEYSVFLDRVVENKDFDLAILEIEGENSPILDLFFKEDSFLNIFNFKNEMDNGTTASYIANITKEMDFNARKNYFYELQEHLMKDLLLMVPLYTPARFFAYYDNLKNFSAVMDFSHSIPYMAFEGLHQGQESINTLKIGTSEWDNFSPVEVVKRGEKVVLSLIMDKLIELDEKNTPIKRGLIDDWTYENDTTLILHVRDGIEWQPDNDELFTGELFTVDDVIFTLDLYTSPDANNNYEIFDWIKSYETNGTSHVKIYIDSDPSTEENEPYAFALEELSIYPYPEFYLNTESTISQIISSVRYTSFAQSPFGTGKYRFNSSEAEIDFSITLKKFDNWHGIGYLGSVPTDLKFEFVELKSYTDPTAMNFDLNEGGVIDIADFGKNPELEESYELNEFKKQFRLENSLVFMAFNMNDNNFGGENNNIPTEEEGVSRGLAIRRALASMVDKASINIAFNGGKYNVTETPIPRYYSDYYYQSVTTYPYSVSEAIENLRLAGYNVSTNPEDYETEASFSLVSVVTALSLVTGILVINRKKAKKK